MPFRPKSSEKTLMDNTSTPQTENSETSTQSQSVSAQPKPTFTLAPEYFELYANNVFFESSVWDLNLIFGVFDQTPDAPPSKRFGAVRIPWRQAKLMTYMLAMNVAFHESSNGPINIPSNVAPPDIMKFIEQHYPNDPKAKEMGERINRVRAELGL
jgi:uncharacterized protein DUF3467